MILFVCGCSKERKYIGTFEYNGYNYSVDNYKIVISLFKDGSCYYHDERENNIDYKCNYDVSKINSSYSLIKVYHSYVDEYVLLDFVSECIYNLDNNDVENIVCSKKDLRYESVNYDSISFYKVK